MPDRIQRRRDKGFRLPPGTLCVTRPGRKTAGWPGMGNPFAAVWHGSIFQFWDVVGPVLPGCPYSRCDTELEAVKIAVDWYEAWAPQQPWFAERLAEARAALHIACWCPIGSPCHGDLWCAWANGATS